MSYGNPSGDNTVMISDFGGPLLGAPSPLWGYGYQTFVLQYLAPGSANGTAQFAATTQDVALNPFAQAVFSDVYRRLNGLDPEPCGGGVFGFRGEEHNFGLAKGGAYVTFTRDTQSGVWAGALGEAGFGPVSGGYEKSVNLSTGRTDSSFLLFFGKGFGFFGAFNRNQIQLGFYGSGGNAGGGPYLNLVPGGECQ
jgi:hypothetical protein